MADGFTTARPKRRGSLEEISVHVLDRKRPQTRGPYITEVNKVPSRYVYINEGYSGSVPSLNPGASSQVFAPPTGVVREQYWTCSKWPRGQRLMAMALGVLAGAVIGLAITMGMRAAGHDPNILSPVFRSSVPE